MGGMRGGSVLSVSHHQRVYISSLCGRAERVRTRERPIEAVETRRLYNNQELMWVTCQGVNVGQQVTPAGFPPVSKGMGGFRNLDTTSTVA